MTEQITDKNYKRMKTCYMTGSILSLLMVGVMIAVMVIAHITNIQEDLEKGLLTTYSISIDMVLLFLKSSWKYPRI